MNEIKNPCFDCEIGRAGRMSVTKSTYSNCRKWERYFRAYWKALRKKYLPGLAQDTEEETETAAEDAPERG